jgi:ParB family chromosome partitioning protein
MKINISEITIQNRYRREYGDIQGLANSISKIGLLHEPIITQDKKLIDGERRLKALQMLGFSEVNVRVVNVPSVLKAEHDANAFAKAWTVSEKVAIAKAIEEEMVDRQGERTDLELRDKCPEVDGKRTRDLVAEKSGFGSGKSYQRAKKAMKEAIPEIIEKMDKGDISINSAALVSSFPEEEQKEIITKINQGEKPTKAIKQHIEAKEPVVQHSTALQFSSIAISQLSRIKQDDVKRVEALNIVLDYINKQLSEKK